LYFHRSGRVAILTIALAAIALRAAGQTQSTAVPKVQAKLLLPAPPSVGSEEQKAEIEEILAIQATRTDAQIKQFRSQETLSLAAFKDIIPDWFSPNDLPKLKKLYQAMSKDSAVAVDEGKSYFKRRRPYQEDSRIQPLGRHDNEFAYPSGHATRGMLYATILAQIAPDKADALLERGRQIGWNRVIGGMHHSSDIAAGRVLGQAIARSLLRSAEFKAELAEVKEEYEAAKKSHAEAGAPVH
jgi:acid phosphatase (class A)